MPPADPTVPPALDLDAIERDAAKLATNPFATGDDLRNSETMGALVRALRAAREDSKRLDWLNEVHATLHSNWTSGPEAFTLTYRWDGEPDGRFHGHDARAAIDAARAAEED